MHIARTTALAAAFGALAFGAQAVTVDLINHSTQGGGNTADQYASGYAANTPLNATFSADPTVTPPPGNQSGVYQSPFNNTVLLDTQSYFSVGGIGAGGGANSPVTLTLGAPVDEFTMLWGSIDSYNTIGFYSGATFLGSFSGTDIVNEFSLGGSPLNFEQVALLNFSDFGQDGLTSITFSSGDGVNQQAAFEFALAPVPLPASILMLLGGLAGLGGLGVLRRRAPA